MNKPLKTNDKLKKFINVPSFIKERSMSKSNDLSVKLQTKVSTCKEFLEITLSDNCLVKEMNKRIDKWIEGTPKVTLISQNNNFKTFKISSPSKSLFQVSHVFSQKFKFQKILEIVSTFFRLVDQYGYFYCDSQMIKISSEGVPVVWIHKNFSCSLSEFPIQQSSVSQLIFIKKIKQTFNELVNFPKNIPIQSKIQLLAFLEQEEKKIPIFLGKCFIRNQNHFKESNTNNKQNNPLIANFPSFRLMSPPSLKLAAKNLTYSKTSKLDLASSFQSIHDSIRSGSRNSNAGKFRRWKKSITINFQNCLFSDIVSQNKSNESKNDRTEKQISDSSKKGRKKQINNLNKPICHPKILIYNKSNKKMQEFEDEINDEQLFQQECTIEPKSVNLNRNRKQSVELKKTYQLKRDISNAVKTLAVLTFSTRDTLSSVKGQLESDNEENHSKNDGKQSNFCIRSEIETKQKSFLNIQKQQNNIHQTNLKICEENSFEYQFQNLLQFEENVGSCKKNVRESYLVKELNKLFDDSANEGIQSSYLTDFMSVLK